MELIKPFVKYSRPYRACKDSDEKNRIYDEWSEAISLNSHRCTGARPANAAADPNVCDFCYAGTENSFACRQCLFPCCEDEEIATYSLLSVCFYEANEDDVRRTGQDRRPAARDQHTVWVQRLKLAWRLNERAGKTYRVVYDRCVQCETPTPHLGHATAAFDYRLFCDRCLFPLFAIETRLRQL